MREVRGGPWHGTRVPRGPRSKSAALRGLDGMAAGFFAPKGLQQISPGQSGAARAAERRPGSDFVFNR